MDIKKIAYGLSIAYAKSKFENELRKGTQFYHGAAPEEIEELEYLIEQFTCAYDYYSNIDETELKNRMNQT